MTTYLICFIFFSVTSLRLQKYKIISSRACYFTYINYLCNIRHSAN